MFKKAMIWTAWLGSCFAAGYFGSQAFIKAAAFVQEKLDECD